MLKKILSAILCSVLVVAMAVPVFAVAASNQTIYAYAGSSGCGVLNRYGSGAIAAGQTISIYPYLQNSPDQKWNLLDAGNGNNYIVISSKPSLALNLYGVPVNPGASQMKLAYPCTLQPYTAYPSDTTIRLEGSPSSRYFWLTKNNLGYYYLRADRSAVSSTSDVLWFQSASALNDKWKIGAGY